MSQYGADTDLTYRTAGFGGGFAWGRSPALVVVDLTRGFTEDAYPSGSDLTDVVLATTRLVAVAHEAGVPVIYTSIVYTPAEAAGAITWLRKASGMRALLTGSDEVQLDPRLPRSDSDLHITKKGASAFFGTALATLLTSARCDTVVVCGATTSGCVRASVVDAVQHGWPVVVPSECVGDRAQGPHEAALFDMQAKYADVVGLPPVMRYLSTTTQS